MLAKNVIRPSSRYDESKAEEDLNLLQRACACYKELDARTQANNHTRRVGRAFESLLEVVNLIKTSQQLPSPQGGMQQGYDARSTPGTSNVFGEQHRSSESRNLPSPPSSSMPPASWEGFSNKNTSTTTPGGPNARASPGLITPIDSLDPRYQSYDPLRQDLIFPYIQQHIMRPPSSNPQQASEADVSMDYFADPRLLSDIMETNPSMSF